MPLNPTKGNMPKRIDHRFEDGVELRWCGCCKQFLPLDSFNKNPQTWDKLDPRCRSCNSVWHKQNRDKIREREKVWVRENPERVRSYKKRYRDSHPETMKAIYNRRAKKVLSTIEGHLNNIMRVTMKYSLSGNKHGCWKDMVPYTVEELKEHLEKQFQPGMSWENHKKYGWHIDHKRPIRSFNFTSHLDPEFKECWALSNLQPLWWNENLKKSCNF